MNLRRSTTILALALLIAGCSAATDAGAWPSSDASSAAAVASPFASPTSLIGSDADWSALPDLAANVLTTTPLTAAWPTRFASATEDGIWLPNMNERAAPAVARLSTETMEQTALIDLGGELDAFPPDAQATEPSAEGIWVTLAYQHAVALIDPATNAVSRRIEIDGAPYSLTADGNTLWVADYEHKAVLHIDAATGEELLRTFRVSGPIEIAVAFGSVWVADHDSGSSSDSIPPPPSSSRGSGWVARRVSPSASAACGPAASPTRSSPASTRRRTELLRPSPSRRTPTTLPSPATRCGCPARRNAAPARTGYLVRIDPASNEADGFLNLPCAFGLVTDGRRLWAGRFDGDESSILELDTAADR